MTATDFGCKLSQAAYFFCDGNGGPALARRDKLAQRLKSRPKDFTWDEVVRLLRGLGYAEVKPGRTGGSRRRFVHPIATDITLHRPHPGNIVRMYAVDQLIEVLTDEKLI